MSPLQQTAAAHRFAAQNYQEIHRRGFDLSLHRRNCKQQTLAAHTCLRSKSSRTSPSKLRIELPRPRLQAGKVFARCTHFATPLQQTVATHRFAAQNYYERHRRDSDSRSRDRDCKQVTFSRAAHVSPHRCNKPSLHTSSQRKTIKKVIAETPTRASEAEIASR